MTIEKVINGAEASFILDGWLDTQSSSDFAQALNDLEDSATSLVLDMNGLEYISSAGIRQIVAAHKKMNGALTLRHVSAEIQDVLRMTGLDKRLNIEA